MPDVAGSGVANRSLEVIMDIDRHQNRLGPSKSKAWRLTSNNKGTLLVYLVVVLLVFGVLGVSLVSLFTTATSSSATPNDAKRARFIAESGIRYALSEIRNSDDLYAVAELLNTTSEFKLGKNGGFTTNVFSPGLQSAQNKTIFGSGITLRLDVPFSGKFPEDFDVNNAVNDFYIVDWLRFKGTTPPSDRSARVIGSPDPGGAVDVTLTLDDDYDADLEDTICFALLATDAGTNISRGSSIYVHEKASEFFPAANGAIRIVTLSDGNQYDYFYETREPPSAGKVELTNVREMPGDTWTNIADLRTTDFVILSPYNFRLFAGGRSDAATTEIGYNRPFWAMARPSEYTIYMRELLQDKSIKQAGDVIRTQESGDIKIELGRGNTGTEGFGDLWYGGDKSIGGDNNFCSEGRCIFDLGIRVFYTADVIPGANDGQGFLFALIAGGTLVSPVNTRNSAGGDFQLPELLAYGGSSWTSSGTFLDGSGEGLKPPKMAVEFDTLTDLNVPLDYCTGNNLNLIPGSRNDPQPGGTNKDVVQYVFWGSNDENDLALTCRSVAKESYDDNRHDAESFFIKWTFATSGEVKSSPAVGSDGTIYVGSDDNNVYILNPDDRKRHFEFGDRPFPTANEWQFPTGGNVRSSPLVVENGGDTTIYIGSDDNKFYALDKINKTKLWEFNVGGDVSLGRPSIGPDDNIYVSHREAINPFLYALNSVSGIEAWSFNIGDANEYMAGVDPNSGTIYTDRSGNSLLAVNQDGSQRWVLPNVADVRSTPQVGTDGTIYFTSFYNFTLGFETGEFFAVDPIGAINWRYPGDTGGTGGIGEIYNVPALSNDQSVVYAVTFDEKLYAINTADGSFKWSYSPIGVFGGLGEIQSSPTVDPDDDTIYVGSDEDPGGKILAVNPDGTLRWKFSTPLDVNSTPAVDPISKNVYVGCDDNQLYAINQIADPRNFRNTYVDFQRGFLTSANLDSTVDVSDPDNWLDGKPMTKGPWAVRTEIKRATSVNANGKYEYTLLTWLRQCAQSDCSDIKGTPFQDTTGEYTFLPGPPFPDLPFEQVIELTPAEHDDFERFLFGFTTAASATDTQAAEIRDFQLTFIQSGDPTIIADPTWLP